MKNLVGYWVNLARAYEIALLGDFSIQIVFDPEYINGFIDYQQIKSFYNNVKFVKEGDLIVHIDKPLLNDKIQFETLDNIIKRVEAKKSNIVPSFFKDDSCDRLLKASTNRLDFSFDKVDKVIKIASIIAQLDNKKLIESKHISEAIFCSYCDYIVCNAEDNKINFGKGIEIALHKLDNIDIQNAIEYLTSRLKI